MGKIITISREFGSGGRELARRLAEALGYDYYDKEVITEISKHTDLSEDFVRNVMHSRPHSLYPITVGHSISYSNDHSFHQMQSVFAAQNEILNGLADKSDCVIVGRCADYVLKDRNPYRIFVYADMEFKVNRCINRADNEENLNEKQMKKHILAIDKQRAKFYNFYTSQKWGDKNYYDLMVNSSKTPIKEIAPAIAKMFKD